MTKTTAKDDEDACYCIGGKRMKVGRGELKRSLGVGTGARSPASKILWAKTLPKRLSVSFVNGFSMLKMLSLDCCRHPTAWEIEYRSFAGLFTPSPCEMVASLQIGPGAGLGGLGELLP